MKIVCMRKINFSHSGQDQHMNQKLKLLWFKVVALMKLCYWSNFLLACFLFFFFCLSIYSILISPWLYLRGIQNKKKRSINVLQCIFFCHSKSSSKRTIKINIFFIFWEQAMNLTLFESLFITDLGQGLR